MLMATSQGREGSHDKVAGMVSEHCADLMPLLGAQHLLHGLPRVVLKVL